jgi:hypothetical protein
MSALRQKLVREGMTASGAELPFELYHARLLFEEQLDIQTVWRCLPKFPAACAKFAVSGINFPDISDRETLEKRLLNGDFRARNCLWKLKNAIFPAKFPISRELGRRRVRSALRRQPAFSKRHQPLLE